VQVIFKQNYARGFVVLACAGVISQIITLLTWRYLGLLLTRETIGEFSLNIFWIELLSVLSLMGVETFYPKYVYDSKFKNSFYNFGRDIAILSVIFSVIFFVINGVFELIYIDKTSFYLIIIGSVLVVTNFRYSQNILLVNKDLVRYGLYQVLRPTIFVIAVIVFFNLNIDVHMYLGYLISFSCLFIMSLVNKKAPFKSFGFRRLLPWLKHSYHFGAVGILGVLSSYSSRLLTDQVFTISEVGTLALLLSFSAPVKSIISVFDKVYYPSAIRRLSQTGNLELGNLRILFGMLAVAGFVVLKATIPLIGTFLLAKDDLSSLNTLSYLFYTFLPIIIWTLYVPVIIHNRPKMYARVKLLMTLFIIVFQAVIFNVTAFENIGLPLYISECIYLVGLILVVRQYISPNEIRVLILLSLLCLLPIFFA